MKHTSSIAVFSLAATLALPSLAARVPYANDFSTRTSGLSPSDRWMEMPYSTGLIANPYSSYSYRQPYYQGGKIQDGWAMPQANAADNFSFAVVNIDGNQALEAKSTTSGKHSSSAIVQPLYNEFTNGVIKFSVDIRTPTIGSSMPESTDDYVYFLPQWKSALDLEKSGGYSDAAIFFGMRGTKSGEKYYLRPYAIQGKEDGSGGESVTTTFNLVAGRWYRYEIEVNLDDNTSQCAYIDLDTGARTVVTKGGVSALRNYPRSASSSGGVAGVGLCVKQVLDGPSGQLPLFDNLSVAWKMTAGADYTVVYENDFTTRRYRSLGGTTAGAYELAPTSVSSTSVSYGHGSVSSVYGADEDACQRLVPDSSNDDVGHLSPTGVDGWRRFDGRLKFTLIDPNKNGGYGWANGALLRPTCSTKNGGKTLVHAHLVHPIGTELTTGKVRLYFDMMAAEKYYYSSDLNNAWLGVYLGSALDAVHQVSSSAVDVIMANRWSFGGGIYSSGDKGGSNNNKIEWMASSADSLQGRPAGIDSAKPAHSRWYRFRLTADLDAKTYDIVAYYSEYGRAMGDTSFMTDDNIRLSVSGLGFPSSAPNKIDSVILSVQHAATYGLNNKPSYLDYSVGCYPLVDSIRICRVNADGSDGEEIYSNDFENCTRTVEVDSAVVGVATDRTGADGWTARGVLQNKVYATGENPAVVLNGSDDYAQRILQPLGIVSKGAAEMTVVADIRPPRVWAKESGSVSVELGDDAYWQGNLSSARSYLSAPRISFGFREPGGQAKKLYGYTNCCFAVTSAEGTALSDALPYRDGARNWYRFKATVNPSAGTFAVAVYDQGATQPTAASADGELVATFADQPLPALTGKGFSTLGLSGSLIAGSRGFDANDPDVALVDNLSVDSVPFGMSLLIR